MNDPLVRLVGFGRLLRRRGLAVGTGRILTFCRAASLLDPADSEALRLAARATLVSRREDFEALDAAFDAYMGALAQATPDEPRIAEGQAGSSMQSSGWETRDGQAASRWRPTGDEDTEGEAALRIVASEVEVLRTKSFEELSEDERAAIARQIRSLKVSVPTRRSRRYRSAPKGPRFDVRTTLRRSLRTEGEPFRRAWRAPGVRQRPLVLILDVSGSMAPFSRALLQFAYAAMASGRKVEVFCFGTRLTRLTRAVRAANPDRALAQVSHMVEDWEGGTRIGESLKELLEEWGQRSVLRGSVAVLCSDGLDRGEPDVLAAQMARLSRLAARVVWANPLRGSPRYEPLARGMAAALPFLDVFLPGHNLESLEALSEALAG